MSDYVAKIVWLLQLLLCGPFHILALHQPGYQTQKVSRYTSSPLGSLLWCKSGLGAVCRYLANESHARPSEEFGANPWVTIHNGQSDFFESLVDFFNWPLLDIYSAFPLSGKSSLSFAFSSLLLSPFHALYYVVLRFSQTTILLSLWPFCLILFIFWLWQFLVVACGTFSCGTWGLVPWPGAPDLPVWSLSYWTTGEVPLLPFESFSDLESQSSLL